MKKLVIALKIRKNEKHARAALVSSVTGFSNCLILSVDEAVDVQALNCLHSLNGKPGNILAKQWLFGGGSKLKNKLSTVNTRTSKHEFGFSDKSIKFEFKRSLKPHSNKVERAIQLY